MESAPRLSQAARPQAVTARFDFQGYAAPAFGFLLVVYLGLKGGGYAPLERNQIGIAIWWGLLLGFAVGALPLRSLAKPAWMAVGLLAAFVTWVGLSTLWSSSPDRSIEDLARITTYLGVFAMALGLRSSKGVRRVVSAVGAGIVVIAAVGLLSRLHPAWFPDAKEALGLLPSVRSRLAYPLGYWNGMGALVAIGLPLILYLAASARHIAVQAVSAAALPCLGLTLYLTFSRGGVLAAAVSLVAYLALTGDRVRKGATALVAALGTTILILAVHQRPALEQGLSNDLARHQGNEILAMTLIVCAGVGMLQAGLGLYLKNSPNQRLLRPSRRTLRACGLVAATAAVAVVVGLFASGKVSHAWNEFTESSDTGNSAARLHSFSSDGRLPYWHTALDEFEAHPLAGGGSGSYAAWWAQHREKGGFVQDAHSLYLETLAELGIVGLALLLSFFGLVLAIGFRNYVRAARSGRDRLAAGLAAMLAFVVGVAYDWIWEIPVLPVAFLLLAAVVVTAGGRSRRRALGVGPRIGLAAASVVAMVAIAIPLAAGSSLQESQAAVRSGDLGDALLKAEQAARIEPFTAAPHLQKALVLEEQGRLAEAEAAAADAVEAEPDEWRAWVVQSRLQAKLGQVGPAIHSYRQAKRLNPHSPLFQ